MGTFSAITGSRQPVALPVPAEITVEGKRHKLTERQWRALVRCVRHFERDGDAREVFQRALVEQLARKGLGTAFLSSIDAYRPTEWNRRVGAALYPFRPYPAVVDAVRAIMAERARIMAGG